MSYNQRAPSSSSSRSSRSRSDRSRSEPEQYRGAPSQGRYGPDDDYEDYGSRTRHIQNESLESSSRALGRLMHASEIAQSNLAKLASQSEQLEKVDKRLDEADHHVQVSETKTTRLKALNRWFFMPAIGAKSAKRRQESLEAKEKDKQDQRIKENERERDVGSRSSRPGKSGSAPIVSSRGSSSVGKAGHIHSTPEGLQRDDVEEGIDSNLNQISAGLGRLKMMGASMNNELGRQTAQLSRIQDRTDVNKDKISRLNKQMNQLSK